MLPLLLCVGGKTQLVFLQMNFHSLELESQEKNQKKQWDWICFPFISRVFSVCTCHKYEKHTLRLALVLTQLCPFPTALQGLLSLTPSLQLRNSKEFHHIKLKNPTQQEKLQLSTQAVLICWQHSCQPKQGMSSISLPMFLIHSAYVGFFSSKLNMQR